MTEIRLVKPWGRFAAGTALRVWRPGELLAPGVVDPARAMALVEGGYARVDAGDESSTPAPAAASSSRRSRRSAPAGGDE